MRPVKFELSELYEAMGDYTVPLHMSRGLDRVAERALYEQLVQFAETLRTTTSLGRADVANLVEFVHASWAQVDAYSGPERQEVARSVSDVSETLLAALNGEALPPLTQPHKAPDG